MAENIKQHAVTSNADDMLKNRSEPAYYRSLPGELPNHLLEMNRAGATGQEIFKASHAYEGMREGMLVGNLSKGYASFGLGISNIHTIDTVQTIVDRICAGIPA